MKHSYRAFSRFSSRFGTAMSTAKSPMSSAPCDFVLVPDGEFREAEFRETQAPVSRELQLVLDPEFL